MPVEPCQGMSNDVEAAGRQLSLGHSSMKVPALHSLLRKKRRLPIRDSRLRFMHVVSSCSSCRR